jgi:hypothetical protein
VIDFCAMISLLAPDQCHCGGFNEEANESL